MRRIDRWITWARLRGAVLALVVGWVAWLTWAAAASEQDAQQATSAAQQAERTADQLAADIDRVCKQGGTAADQLGAACISAERVITRPLDLPEPQQGEPGRGITSTTVRDGRLMVRYTDGSTDTLGRVVGQSGADGEPGRGIASVTTSDGRLSITYTDGSVEVAGDLPRGPQGEQGERGERGPQGAPPQQWTWTDPEDGTRYTCSRDEDSPNDAPTYTCRADQTDTTETSSPLDPPG